MRNSQIVSRSDTKSLIEENGMAEYFDQLLEKGLGGGMNFSWTAAIYLDLCRNSLPEETEFIEGKDSWPPN